MNKFSFISIDNSIWNYFTVRAKSYDFYHTQCYHLLEEDNNAILFVYEFDNNFIALPLIIRSIPNSNYKDCTSAYGYAGPISDLAFDKIPINIFAQFKERLLTHFNKRNVVSAFSRLHPLIDTGNFFENFGVVKDLNKTVAIDLSLEVDEQRKRYRKSTKSEINQLRGRYGYEVIEAKSEKDIDSFISIYYESMKRVNATDNYYFKKEYFHQFLNNKCFDSKLLLAITNGEIAAGAIFTVTNKIMQYHLAGTNHKFIRQTPMKLILDEARLLANNLDLEFLHLGGGVGGSDDDSLFRFKAGFSDYRCQFRVWNLIVDKEKYNSLIDKNTVDWDSNYFPLYRLYRAK